MNVVATEIPDVKIVEPQVFGDSRGWFVEQYNAGRYKAAGIDADFVQDNGSPGKCSAILSQKQDLSCLPAAV